jgi:hypothetical protein
VNTELDMKVRDRGLIRGSVPTLVCRILIKTQKDVMQGNRSPGRDLNSKAPGFKAGVLIGWIRYEVRATSGKITSHGRSNNYLHMCWPISYMKQCLHGPVAYFIFAHEYKSDFNV